MISGSYSAFTAEMRAAALSPSPADLPLLERMWAENLERRTQLRNLEITDWSDDVEATIPRSPDQNLFRASGAQLHRTDVDPDGDLTALTIAELGSGIASRRISVTQVVRAYLHRIEDCEDRVRSYLHLCADDALSQAEALDAELAAGRSRGPLHGVPIAVKDMIAVKGLPLTCGSRAHVNRIASEDAAVVRSLRRNGAIVLGKNSQFEFGFGPMLTSGRFATGLNPLDPRRITAGSSSGSAAGVAARLCAGAIGTDTAGSVRLPATHCGVVGFKPTTGALATEGVVPMCWSLDCIGPLARNVGDARLLAAGMLGELTAGGTASPVDLKGLRIGFLEEDFAGSDRISGPMRQCFEAARDWVEAEGAVSASLAVPYVDESQAVYVNYLAETFAAHGHLLSTDPDALEQQTRLQLSLAGMVSAEDYLRARVVRRRIQKQLAEVFDRYDILILPAQGGTAPLIADQGGGTVSFPRSHFTRYWNLAGTPAISQVCATAPDGLPLSLQFVAAPHDDRRLLDFAETFEAGFGGVGH